MFNMKTKTAKGSDPYAAPVDTESHNGSDPIAVRARGLTKHYGSGDAAVRAICNVDLDVCKGEFVAVMGPSGSGKSTLMHVLAGLDRADSGAVSIEGDDISQMNDKELTLMRRKRVGFIFQAFNLLPQLTAEENVTLPVDLAGDKVDKAWVDEVLGRVALTDRRHHKPTELSGGQQQRVAIARALISKPTVLFADEPTGNLDSTTGTEILELLRRSVDEYGQTMVMVTHDARAAAMAHRVLFLADGEIVRELAECDTHRILEVLEEIAA
jgi:putative ABC transport system ATP-binding protein